ncbi:unnamed protein product [Staurois parvus]|uniref:Uncharacterized protein n=1 Tax=Staurois parvus TaxID=386267 RepID=A0ABN9FLA8_9NEOB|nr:unnamed protein product [Staurois parvus]
MKKVPSLGAPYLPWALGQYPSFQMVSPPLSSMHLCISPMLNLRKH